MINPGMPSSLCSGRRPPPPGILTKRSVAGDAADCLCSRILQGTAGGPTPVLFLQKRDLASEALVRQRCWRRSLSARLATGLNCQDAGCPLSCRLRTCIPAGSQDTVSNLHMNLSAAAVDRRYWFQQLRIYVDGTTGSRSGRPD